MSQVSIFNSPVQQFFDNNGAPLAGGFLYFYDAGTTSPKSVYSDSTGTVALSNPVILDSAGRASVWLSGYYYVVLTDSLGNMLWSKDNVSSQYNQSTSTIQWLLQSDVLTYISATQFSVPGNVSATYQVGQRIKAVVSAGTVYGTISAVSVSGAPFISTITVIWDSGQLDVGLNEVSLGILTITNPSMPIFPVNILNNANSANYSFLKTDLNKITEINFSSNSAANYTLLSPSVVPSGSWMWIKNNGTGQDNVISFVGTINGVANMILSPYDDLFIWSDGVTWSSKTSKSVVTCVNTSNLSYTDFPCYSPLVAWGAANSSTEAPTQTAMPGYGFVKNLSTKPVTNGTTGGQTTVTLRKNGSNSTLTCGILGANTFQNDIGTTGAHMVAFNKGDYLNYLITTTANAGAMQNLTISAELIIY
jgi:hypothetical protein